MSAGGRRIFFVWIPGFYAAVERADDPSLRGRPVVVGGDPGKRGVVASASREAQALGIEEGIETARALELCPEAELRSTQLKRYREVSSEVLAILRTVTDRLEERGLDGTFLETPEVPEPVLLAAEICVRIQAELGLPAVAGIGRTRLVSYLAAKHAGPGGIRYVRDPDSRRFLSRFPVTELWGLGPATAERLARHGIELVADLQVCALDRLREIAGRDAARLLALARADDSDPLHPRPPSRTLSQEQTLPEPLRDTAALGEQIAEMARRLEGALRRERRVPRRVTLSVDFAEGGTSSRTVTLDRLLDASGEIGGVAVQLLGRLLASRRPIRRLRLQVGRLARATTGDDGRQLRLF